MASIPAFAQEKLEIEKIRKTLAVYLSTPTGIQEIERLEPAINSDSILLRLNRSAEMMHLLNASQTPPIETLYEVTPALEKSRIERFVIDGSTLYQIGRWAESARKLRSFFSQHRETATQLWSIAEALIPLKQLEQQIQQVVDEKGDVHSDASPELQRINRQIQSRKQNARSILQRILREGRESGMISDEDATLRGGRLVIPVRSEYKRKIKGFIHDSSATGQTVYIEPVEVFENNNEIRELESDRKAEIERLLRELTGHVGQHAAAMKNNLALVGQLDACYACARLGMRWDGTIPEITNDGSVALASCRNPLLLLKFSNFKEGKKHVVPLNIEMSVDEKGIIITGPNAGGKSVTLKTFGLAIILTQYGIPIPAQEGARIPPATGLYIDMGDEQSIENDLSTFSSRLTWMKDVLKNAKPGSWVLIDEAGSGTDPDEGTALVQSLLEILSEQGVRSIITTHHGTLKIFAHNTVGWSNASMEFDQESLSPTYFFKKGIPGSSYAFEIADRLHLPGELTRRARKRIGEGKNKLESLILSLEEDSQELQNQRDKISREKHSLEKSKKELDTRLENIQQEREKIRDNAVEEAEALLKDANRKIEEAIRSASRNDKEELKQKRKEVQKVDSKVREQKKQQKKARKQTKSPLRPPEVGDKVRLIDSNTPGELLEIHGNKATVDINGLRLKTGYSNIEVSASSGHEKKGKQIGIRVNRQHSEDTRPFSGRIDIRGKRGEEAIREVTRFVDEGLSRGIQQLTIIHGRGDGILRKLVHEYLQSRPDVKGFEAAPVEEGGDGCTYVYM